MGNRCDTHGKHDSVRPHAYPSGTTRPSARHYPLPSPKVLIAGCVWTNAPSTITNPSPVISSGAYTQATISYVHNLQVLWKTCSSTSIFLFAGLAHLTHRALVTCTRSLSGNPTLSYHAETFPPELSNNLKSIYTISPGCGLTITVLFSDLIAELASSIVGKRRGKRYFIRRT